MKFKEKVKSTVIIGTGSAIGIGGQTAAMSIATTFGTASTGTSISALSGVAATNATTAWLGGGALAAGGGGMAAGSIVLAAIPFVGVTVAVAGVGYGIHKYFKSKNKKAKNG